MLGSIALVYSLQYTNKLLMSGLVLLLSMYKERQRQMYCVCNIYIYYKVLKEWNDTSRKLEFFFNETVYLQKYVLFKHSADNDKHSPNFNQKTITSSFLYQFV